MSTDSSPKVAVMGAGAVGSYFGAMLARGRAEVTLIGRAAHVGAIVKNGLLLETNEFETIDRPLRQRRSRRRHWRPVGFILRQIH